MLQDALVALMIEKGYEDTTVQDIIDRANVGRATFYSHFADKKTLLVSRIEDLRASLVEKQREALATSDRREKRFAFSLPMLEHARAHLPLYAALTGRESGAFVLQRIQQMIADLVQSDLVVMGFTRASTHRDLLVQHVAGGFMAVIYWWLDNGAKLSASEVDEIFRKLSLHGLAADLRL